MIPFEDDDFEDDAFEYSIEEEIEILDEAYNTAYLLATKKTTITKLLDNGSILYLPFDPDVPETLSLIMEDMINYFEDNEEYEKCAELLKVKEKDDSQ